LNSETSMTIDCTDVTITGNIQEDGTGTATVTYASCQESTFASACTIDDNDMTITIQPDGSFTVTNAIATTIACGAVLQCNVATTPQTDLAGTDGFTKKPSAGGTQGTFATKATGSIVGGDEPTISLSGNLFANGALCTTSTMALTGAATIDAAGDVPRGTGNDLTIED
jgi:hypothetical protein